MRNKNNNKLQKSSVTNVPLIIGASCIFLASLSLVQSFTTTTTNNNLPSVGQGSVRLQQPSTSIRRIVNSNTKLALGGQWRRRTERRDDKDTSTSGVHYKNDDGSSALMDEEILEDADNIGKSISSTSADGTTSSNILLPPIGTPISDSFGSSLAEELLVTPVGGGLTGEQTGSSNVTEFLLGGANNLLEANDLLVDRADKETDVSTSEIGEIASSAENVGAVLAAAEAAAETTLMSSTSDIVDSIPLIPGSEDTIGVIDDSIGDDDSDDSPVIGRDHLGEQQGQVHVDEPVEITTAKSVVGESIVESIEAPSVKKILTFAVPAIGVWLCSPLLSLIDTSAVGVFSGTVQQAALNPAVAVTDYAALLVAFLFTATTNLVASAQESDRGVEGKPKTSAAFTSALKLSGFVGLGLGTILLIFAKQLLNAIIGNDGISPQVFSAAMKYVRIRALGMPAAAIIGSAQAACLGMQDVRSPLYVLLAAAVVNFFGDLSFVASSHPWFGGAAGAAWATVFSQYAAVACFVHWLCNKPRRSKPKVLNLTNSIMEFMEETPSSSSKDVDLSSPSRRNRLNDAAVSLQRKTSSSKNRIHAKVRSFKKKIGSMFTTKSQVQNDASKQSSMKYKSVKKDEDTFSVRGFLSGKFSGREFLTLPSKESLKEFAPYVLPVTTTQIGRVSGYVAMAHVVSSSLGTMSMAAQQIIVSIFYCLTPIADSLNLIAQSFVPGLVEKKNTPEKAKALKKTFFNFMKASSIFDVFMVGGVSCIPFLCRFFTSDPAVISLVNSVVPLLMGIFSIHALVMTSEGYLLGQKDLGFLGKSYAGYFFALPYLMLRVKKAALAGCKNASIASLWQIFFGYNVFRLFVWIGRIAMLQYRTERNVKKISSEAQLI